MYYGDNVLGHLGSVCPVHIVAYGVLKAFLVVKACSQYCTFIVNHV
jgi:hypothetical protein